MDNTPMGMELATVPLSRSMTEGALGTGAESFPASWLTVELFERGQQFVRGGGAVADAGAGRTLDGGAGSGTGTTDSKLADALAAQWAAMEIVLMQKHDIHL